MKQDSNKKMQSIGRILADFDWDQRKYIAHEFQDYGYRLAQQLSDLPHRALYIRLAKKEPRRLLEEALRFVKEANEVRNSAKLFMWKLKQLRKEQTKR